MDRTTLRRAPWRPYLPALAGLIFAAGCSSAMSDSSTGTPAPGAAQRSADDGTVAAWPLRFQHHDFAVACFDTQSCQVRYHGFDFGNPEPTPPAATLSPQARDEALSADYGPVPRETPPAQARWRSKDGSELQASIDIAAIFADGLVRHEVPREDIAEGVSIGSTGIVLEIDDRTVNVYSRTLIPLKAPRDPANPDSDIRNDLIRVYSRSY